MSADSKKMTKRIALFRDMKFDHVTTFDMIGSNENYAPSCGDYVRISEWQTIEFKPLTAEEVAVVEMGSLTKLREKVVDEFAGKLKFIDERMANLRALTGPSAP